MLQPASSRDSLVSNTQNKNLSVGGKIEEA
jgi:hypothetical protein